MVTNKDDVFEALPFSSEIVPLETFWELGIVQVLIC